MNRNEEEEIIDSLSAEFQKVLDFNEELSNSPLSSNDPEYQVRNECHLSIFAF